MSRSSVSDVATSCGLGSSLVCVCRVASPLGQQAELQGQADQPLLGAVVQVAFQTAALLLGLHHRAREPCSSCKPGLQFGLAAGRSPRRSRRRGDRLDQLRLLAEPCVVDQRRHLLTVLLDERDRRPLSGSGRSAGFPSWSAQLPYWGSQ